MGKSVTKWYTVSSPSRETAHSYVPGANEIERVVKRNAAWATDFLVEMTRALLRDGRPPFTEKIPKKERVQMALQAPPEWWAQMQSADPFKAAQIAAEVVKARAKGEIPQYGPHAPIDPYEELPEPNDVATKQELDELDERIIG